MSILDMIHVKKRHNTDYGTLLKCYPWSQMIFGSINTHCWLLLRISRNLSLR